MLDIFLVQTLKSKLYLLFSENSHFPPQKLHFFVDFRALCDVMAYGG